MQVDVVVRVRPLLLHEHQESVAVHITPGKEQAPSSLTLLSPDADPIDYTFDKCYDESASQRTLFQREISTAVNIVLSGANAMVVACGAPGSGKSFTMEGSEQSVGVIPHCIRRLFRVMEELRYRCEVAASYCEIYEDKARDLFATVDGNLVVVDGDLTKARVTNALEFKEVFERGKSVRATNGTGRGHSVLTVSVRIEDRAGGDTRDGTLHFIELAGGCSESKVEERKLSMAVPRNFVSALKTTASCRDVSRGSKLPRILQSSLTGTSLVVMICNVASSVRMLEQTRQTLNYAQDVRKISHSVTNDSSSPVRSTAVLDLADMLQASPVTPALVVSRGDNTQMKKPLRSPSKQTSEGVKSKKCLTVSPLAPKPTITSGLVGKTKLTMEEKLKQWKKNKQNAMQNKSIGFMEIKRDSGRCISGTGGVKRKFTAISKCRAISQISNKLSAHPGARNKPITITAAKKSSVSVSSHHSRLTRRSPSDLVVGTRTINSVVTSVKCGGVPKPTPQTQTPSGSAQLPIIIEDEGEATTVVIPHNPTPVKEKTTSTGNNKPAKRQKDWSGNPAFDKENQAATSVPSNQNLPAPTTVCIVEKKQELLAKDLIGVAIGFEKRQRVSTTFYIFKRAYHILPKKSTKLAERLKRLERVNPAAVDHTPSQELSTTTYMVEVLERDLMAVLNHGTPKELTELHAIGEKRAKLVPHLRPFHKLEELQRVPGITSNSISRLYEHHTNWKNHQ